MSGEIWVNDPEKKIKTKEQMQEHLQKQVCWFFYYLQEGWLIFLLQSNNADMGKVGAMDENPVKVTRKKKCR